VALRFFRRIKIAPGLTLNLSKRGGSLSVGPRGAKITAGRTGIRQTVGLPGTGLWYTRHQSSGGRGGRSAPASADPPTTPERRLSLGFFQKLFTPPEERSLVEGMRLYSRGDNGLAYRELRQVDHLADAAFMAATLAIQAKRRDEGRELLHQALRDRRNLGRYFKKYGVFFQVSLPITERITARLEPCERAVRLMLAELDQEAGEWRQAVGDLRHLLKLDPTDPVVRLSLCEILVKEAGDQTALKEVVKLTARVENQSEIEAALLLWRGKALLGLNLPTPARDALTKGLRRKKDRSPDLLEALRRARIAAYEALGEGSRARREREVLVAEKLDV